jgi:Cu/Ag efflux protein CusF
MRVLLPCLFLVLCLQGCQGSDPAPAPENAPQIGAAPVQEYQLNGEIVSVDAEKKTAVIKHEEIAGFMAAMTMSYPIPEQADIDKIKAGDRITATVYDQPSESKMWLGNIQVANTPAP